MTLKIKYFKTFVLLIILGSFINACRKDQPTCRGNCVNLSISGNTFIKTSGAALPNVPVEINWFRKAYCIGCTSYKVAAGKSDNEGKFSFNTTIDSSFFREYFLSVRVPADTNYITVPSGGGVNFNEERFYDFNPNAMQHLQFEFYPKTYLTIKLNRVLSDNFNFFSVNHNFTNEFGYGTYIITGPQFATDTTLRVETSADIYTRIVWKKTIIGGQSIEQTDSLICTKNGPNNFTINY